jgi:putative FmdB family regulatory protein
MDDRYRDRSVGKDPFMPMYDYQCLECGKESLIAITLKEHESGQATCPACSSKKLKQQITSFIARTTKKS